jgi:hypothetical protein
VFVTAWAALGATADGYDPTRNAISKLAALGAPTRPAMTAGLVALAAGMALYGVALRPSPVWPLPVVNGLTALAVAALPLGGDVDTAHGVAATVGYLTLAAVPFAVDRRPLAAAIGVVSGACLLASAIVDHGGLFQRLGLTVAHAWVVVSAAGLLRGPTSPSRTRRAGARATRRR